MSDTNTAMPDEIPADAAFSAVPIAEKVQAHAGFVKLYLGDIPPGITAHKAGQFVYVRAGDENARPYSIANAPGGRYIELHIRNGGTGLSRYLCEDAQPGEKLEIAGPYGTCTYRCGDYDRPLLAIAGGTGFAPAKAIIEAALTDAPAREITLYYGAQSFSDIYDFDWLEAMRASHPHFSYALALEDIGDDYTASAIQGRVDGLLTPGRPPAGQPHVYLAGPAPMVAQVHKCLKNAGMDMDRVFWDSELFGELRAL